MAIQVELSQRAMEESVISHFYADDYFAFFGKRDTAEGHEMGPAYLKKNGGIHI